MCNIHCSCISNNIFLYFSSRFTRGWRETPGIRFIVKIINNSWGRTEFLFWSITKFYHWDRHADVVQRTINNNRCKNEGVKKKTNSDKIFSSIWQISICLFIFSTALDVWQNLAPYTAAWRRISPFSGCLALIVHFLFFPKPLQPPSRD